MQSKNPLDVLSASLLDELGKRINVPAELRPALEPYCRELISRILVEAAAGRSTDDVIDEICRTSGAALRELLQKLN